MMSSVGNENSFPEKFVEDEKASRGGTIPASSGVGEDAAAVRYADAGSAAAAFGHVRTSSLPFAETVARLRDAVARAGFWVLHEIDPQAIVARGGYKIGAVRQILFFHPDQMAQVLTANPSALLEAPLKFAVIAMPDGSVAVRWIDPASAFARYGHSALTELGRVLARSCSAIATDALGK